LPVFPVGASLGGLAPVGQAFLPAHAGLHERGQVALVPLAKRSLRAARRAIEERVYAVQRIRYGIKAGGQRVIRSVLLVGE